MKKLSQLFYIPAIWIILVKASGCASVSMATEDKDEAAKTYIAPESKGSVFLYLAGRAVGAAGQLSVKVNGIDSGRVTLKQVDSEKGISEVGSSKLLVSSNVPQ